MPRGVRRPVVCTQCRAEMPEFAGAVNYDRCLLCGTLRHEDASPGPTLRPGLAGVSPAPDLNR